MTNELRERFKTAARDCGTEMVSVCKDVLSAVDESETCFRNAYNELIATYKAIEDFAQPRLLSHLIVVGRLMEKGLCIEKGESYGKPIEAR